MRSLTFHRIGHMLHQRIILRTQRDHRGGDAVDQPRRTVSFVRCVARGAKVHTEEFHEQPAFACPVKRRKSVIDTAIVVSENEAYLAGIKIEWARAPRHKRQGVKLCRVSYKVARCSEYIVWKIPIIDLARFRGRTGRRYER